MKNSMILCALVLLFVCSCASTPTAPETIPEYKGTITPITIPLFPKYSEASGKIMTSLIIEQQPGSITKMSMSGDLDVKSIGNSLLWSSSIKKLTVNGNSQAPKTPLAEIRYLTDPNGKVDEFEIMLPFFEQQGMNNEQLESFKTEFKKMTNNYGALARGPVKTGDTLLTTNIEGVEINQIISGWGYYNGQRVMVCSTDFMKPTFYSAGYSLINPENYHVVYTVGNIIQLIDGVRTITNLVYSFNCRN